MRTETKWERRGRNLKEVGHAITMIFWLTIWIGIIGVVTYACVASR
jgi:hypothetical protein